jgi:hypothetical protein
VFGGEERSGPRGEHQEGSKSISSRPLKRPMVSKFWRWPQVPNHTRPLVRRVADLHHELAPQTLAHTDEHRVLLVATLLLLHLLQGGEGGIGHLSCRRVLVEAEKELLVTNM